MTIEYSETFLKEAKRLAKKYKHLKSDLKKAVDEIENERDFGIPLGYGIYKKRVANSSIPTGKSGGFRIILFQHIEEKIILLSIYSKTEKATLTDDELRLLVKKCISSSLFR